MTTNTQRTDTAPEKRIPMVESDNLVTIRARLKGAAQAGEAITLSGRTACALYVAMDTGKPMPADDPAEQPSPSTRGEPATDSAGLGLTPFQMWDIAAAENGAVEHRGALQIVIETPGALADIVKAVLAAREPAPVARELDVEAERREFEVALYDCSLLLNMPKGAPLNQVPKYLDEWLVAACRTAAGRARQFRNAKLGAGARMGHKTAETRMDSGFDAGARSAPVSTEQAAGGSA